MTTVVECRAAIVVMAVVLAVGCAHRGVDPFVYGPAELGLDRAAPPACFTAPLERCIDQPARRGPVERLASPWYATFQPDLSHRICRGDPAARLRWLEGARRLQPHDPLEPIYLELLGRCSSPGFCAWAVDTSAAQGEARPVREMLFEAARRWCGEAVGRRALETAASGLGLSLDDMTPWVTDTRTTRCAGVPRSEDPWQDMAGLQAAGCLDLGGWLERHRGAPDATAAALERCVKGSEIRYQEAACLRELAGLDRDRAAALVRADDRRGWGIASTITRYARTLIRFPEEGRLEGELARLGLLPDEPPPPVVPGKAPVLPEEVLEHRGRLASFNPQCPARYCEHAPLVYRLMDLASPVLDDVILEERWPALEAVDLGDGPESVSTTVGGIPVTLKIAGGQGGGFDRHEHERLRQGVATARQQPHLLTAYSRGRAYRLELRDHGGWYDLETVLAALNTMLADRGSDLRYATLDPHCVPCAQVVAGPGSGLIAAAFEGLIEVTDPFKELWTEPGFEP